MTLNPEYVKSLLLQENDKVFNLAEFRPILRDSTLENIKVPKIQFIPNRIVKQALTSSTLTTRLPLFRRLVTRTSDRGVGKSYTSQG